MISNEIKVASLIKDSSLLRVATCSFLLSNPDLANYSIYIKNLVLLINSDPIVNKKIKILL